MEQVYKTMLLDTIKMHDFMESKQHILEPES